MFTNQQSEEIILPSSKSCSYCVNKSFTKMSPDASRITGHQLVKRKVTLGKITTEDLKDMSLEQLLHLLKLVQDRDAKKQ